MEQEANKEEQFEKLGSCKREECRCLHEHGLIPVKNADGSISQYTKAQAQAMRESLQALDEQLGEEK